MGAPMAAGVPPWTEIDHGLTLSPLLLAVGAVVVALVAARFLFGMQLTGRVALVLMFGGLFTPWLADVAGSAPAIGIWFLALLLGSAWTRRSREQ